MEATAIAKRETAPLVPSHTLADLQTLGQVFTKSGFFADTRDAAQAIVKIMAGQELGFSPIASMTGVYIVKGRVSLSANLIAAAIKRSGKYNYRLREHTDDACEIEFFEQGQSVGTSRFTLSDAKRAGTQNMDKFPRNMLFARAMSNGAKWYCADIFGGPIYTPDELGATINAETGEVIDLPAENRPANAQNSPQNAPAPEVKGQAAPANGKADTPPNQASFIAIWKRLREIGIADSEVQEFIKELADGRNFGQVKQSDDAEATFAALIPHFESWVQREEANQSDPGNEALEDDARYGSGNDNAS